MNRKQILEGYKIENEIIVSPGKFEGEWMPTPYFYEQSFFDVAPCGLNVPTVLVIIERDVEQFPELERDGIVSVELYIDDQGFVHANYKEGK